METGFKIFAILQILLGIGISYFPLQAMDFKNQKITENAWELFGVFLAICVSMCGVATWFVASGIDCV